MCIWFNWFSYVLLGYFSCITSQSEHIITHRFLFNRNPSSYKSYVNLKHTHSHT